MLGLNNLQDNENEELQIFVNGIPSRVQPSLVLDYFSQFGCVFMQRLYSDGNLLTVNPVKAAVNTRRGFCVLVAGTLETFNSIVDMQSHTFLGRTVGVSKFRTGNELASHFELVNSRRVIIKKVDSRISLEEVHAVTEKRFGKLEKIYRFEAESIDKATRKENKRKTFTYSVEFVIPESAVVAARESRIFFQNGCKALIEKFKKNKISSYQPVECGVNRNSASKYSDHIFNGHTFTSLSDPTSKLGTPYSAIHCAVKKKLDVSEKRKAAVNIHCLKPTRKLYHCLDRKGELNGNNNGYSSNRLNLRFNLAVPTHSSLVFPNSSVFKKIQDSSKIRGARVIQVIYADSSLNNNLNGSIPDTVLYN